MLAAAITATIERVTFGRKSNAHFLTRGGPGSGWCTSTRRIGNPRRYLVRLRGDGLMGLYALVEPFVRRELSGATVVVVGLPRPGSRSATAEQPRKDPRRFLCNGKNEKTVEDQSPCALLSTRPQVSLGHRCHSA